MMSPPRRVGTSARPKQEQAGHHRISRGMLTRGVPPGDANFGNSDGVVVVPRDELAVITEATEDCKEDAVRANVSRAFV
jgi:hypothetical protein